MPRLTLTRGTALSGIVILAFVYPRASQLLAPMLAFASASLVAFATLASVAAHEYAHAFAARFNGARVAQIAVTLMGGHTTYEAGHLSPRASLGISLAGPAANALIATLCSMIAPLLAPQGTPHMAATAETGDIATAAWFVCSTTAMLNWALLIFNLLPGLPLDGGKALQSLLEVMGCRRQAAVLICAMLGITIGAVTACVGIGWAWLQQSSSSLVILVWAVVIAAVLISGARRAMTLEHWRATAAQIQPREIARPLAPLVPGTDVGSAFEHIDSGGVFIDSSGRVFVPDLAAVHEIRRHSDRGATVSVDAVVAAVGPPTRLPARSGGQRLVEHMAAQQSPAVILVDHTAQPCGVVLAADVARVLEPHNKPGRFSTWRQ